MNTVAENRTGELAVRLEQLARGPRHPGREFVISGCTYADLYDMAANIRRRLPFSGRPETVCLCTENRALLMAALLAGLAGNFSIVLPHALSPQALARLQVATRYGVGISDPPRAFPAGVRVLTSNGAQVAGPADDHAENLKPDADWVKLFTGGSTGRPQLCSKTPENLLGEALYLCEKFGLSADDRIVAAVPPYHIYGLLYSVLVPFVASAAVLDQRPAFPREIERAVCDHEATALVAAPIHYHALQNSAPRNSRLRMAFSSASMLADEDNDAFCLRTGAPIHEVYGSTETGGVASRCRACGQSAFQVFDGVDWKIDSGHLMVRSAFMSPEPDRHADGFVKIGDRARRTGDGGFLLLGRSDGIIKVAGQRVDLDDIRKKIQKIEGVADAVVRALPRPDSRENTIAALVAGGVDGKTILETLANDLEAYALPRRIRIVETIPVTDTGKIDRAAVDRLLDRK
jgi:acyl-coenzyme A synthetase/AMP-(fatty) acid ligase